MSVKAGLPNYNQAFIDLAEHFDQFLQNRTRKHPMLWVDRIPKGTLTNYEGLVRKTNVFHGGLGEQAGLSNWHKVSTSRKPAGADAGFDACGIPTPKTFSYSIEPMQYTGYNAWWQSEPICVNDIRFLHEGREQARLITSFMGYITQSVWENWNREQYVLQAVKAGHAFVLTEGGLDYDSQSVRFDYDPFDSESITLPASLKISTLNWSYFDWWQDFLGDQCPEAAPAQASGLPVFGLVIHKRDFDKMIMEDAQLREDMRYAKSTILFDDYRKFSEFKGWALIHDQRQMRFKYQKTDGTTATFKRVLPMRLGRASADVFGKGIPEANPEYNNAEIAIGVVFMREVFQNLIPNPLGNAGGGMIFGTMPGYNGQFHWVNEYDRELNPLRKNGYFLAEFEAFPKPLSFASDAIVFLYRRCPQTWLTDCAVESFTDTAAAADAVALASAVASGDIDADNKTVVVTLAKKLAGGVGDAVTLVLTGGGAGTTATSAVIAEDALAPTYKLAFASGTIAANDLTTAATVKIT